MQSQERTAAWTHYCCHAVRLVFLLSHGLLVITASASLGNLEQASWWLIFLPVWVGDGLCGVLVLVACCASCPYIKLCINERQPRLRSNPSILTEILPEMVLAILGFFFLVLAFSGEYALCIYLDSTQRGEPKALTAATVLLSIVALLSLCHGTLLTHNSGLFVCVGGGLLFVIVTFASTRSPDAPPAAQAFAVLPAAVAVGGVLVTSLHRLRQHVHLLAREERILRAGEAVILAALLLAVLSLAAKVAGARLAQAGGEGSFAGALLCLLALLRGRLCWWEAREGPLDERRFAQAAEPAANLPRVVRRSPGLSAGAGADAV